ncbi:hypothetical protein CCACVL1_11884, partial [Corchorus capsularis]
MGAEYVFKQRCNVVEELFRCVFLIPKGHPSGYNLRFLARGSEFESCKGRDRIMGKEMTASYGALPSSLMLEILSELPVKALLQFKCVCKSWKDLINSENFINWNLDYSRRRRNKACGDLGVLRKP